MPRILVVRTYVGVVVGLAAIALYLSAQLDPVLGSSYSLSIVGMLAFTALGVGLQLAELRLAVGPVHGAISFIIYIGSVLVFGPTWGALITAVSVCAAQVLSRKPPIRTIFNVAQHVLAVVVGAASYLALGGPIPPEPIGQAVVPFVGFVVTFFAVNSVAVSGVVSLSENRSFPDVWIRNTWGLAWYDLIASGLALGIAWLYVKQDVFGIALVVVPLLFLRHTYLINHQLQQTNRELLELMVKAIEARDPYTSGHSQRVSDIARVLARDIGLSFREVEQIAAAGLLHDVGKIYEEFAPLLRKNGKLAPEERALMETHVVRSAELVSTISNLRGPVERCIRHHHEKFDGTGYPDGLGDEDIPIGARIIMVADTTDAMTTDRPYRKALTYERVVRELEKYSGKQFDPKLVVAFHRSVAIRRLVEHRAPTAEYAAVLGSEKRARLVAH